MNAGRERMLEQIRQAVAEGNRAGTTADLERRAGVGYQGAGTDQVARFGEELVAAGGHFHPVADNAAAVTVILSLLGDKKARPVLLAQGPFLDTLGLEEPLRLAGHEPIRVDALPTGAEREPFFAGAAGITGVDYLVAETGSVVLESRPDQPRSASLLPPLHIAVAGQHQLVPDLFDLFEGQLANRALPACVSIITGPSKTGDIELRLVTGVHGPGEIHLVLVGSQVGHPVPGGSLAGSQPRHNAK